MADDDTVNYQNVKALVRAFDELDTWVEKASQNYSDAEFVLEEAHRGYQRSNYAMQDMLRYLETASKHKQVWKSALLVIVERCASAANQNTHATWKFHAAQLRKAGDRAWRLVVPCAKIIIGGAETINEIIAKFADLDDALEQICVTLDMGVPKVRYSDELQDTLHALIAISRASGNSPYQPVPTAEQIELVKSEIRRRRNVQIVTTASDGESINGQVPPTNLHPEASPRKWDSTIMAFVLLFTALSSLPGLKAIQYSKHSPGTMEDDNFWFLVQGSMMQALGLITIILPLLSATGIQNQPWFWTWGFVFASTLCAGAAIPLYLYVPTEWSAIVAWLGSAFQAFVILQGMIVTRQAVSHVDKNK